MAEEAKKLTVLIVDDDAFLSGIYTTKLEMEGFRVVAARDGEEGLRTAKAEKPSIILLDVLMPKLDGFETLKRLKADSATKSIPVIMLTNLGQKEDIEQAKADGAEDYLIKAHFVPAEAVEKIRDILKKS
ncbi:response regulator [Candidatus Uhrbacteria bacterium CG_4_10_14_0_8_um_filter_58_22]|uniref:Response regulator n=1 Tax=Candidatus Uhrbacteria bacterium CG_4_10_14_0_8_um_filter_58_22 TaxID=1975029 RepID=A0A2M7QBD4_9BACT|nr:MAG: response regulator [Parcubacteria group bacterium CG1_02_58_44]PIY62925.1 MAG: response regulator [Candidatus Uhrbacteria bacterium CG_4_10_14_0_8_um_filter_58_22]